RREERDRRDRVHPGEVDADRCPDRVRHEWVLTVQDGVRPPRERPDRDLGVVRLAEVLLPRLGEERQPEEQERDQAVAAKRCDGRAHGRPSYGGAPRPSVGWKVVWSDRTTLAACALFVVSCAVAYGGLFSHAYPGDVGTYAIYGRALVLDGRIPYRDFYDEYPPGSVGVFALPVLLWNAHYVLTFKLLMTACGIGFVACAAWTLRRLGLSRLRLVPVVLAPALLGPVFLNPYDPVPALVTSLALVPVVARRVRDRTGAAAAFAVAVAVLVLPFVALAPGGVGFSFKSQLERHLEIESVGASILLALSKLRVHHVGYVARSSIDVGGGLADAVGVATSVLLVLLVALVVWTYLRGP